jgi:hypothetical protein
MLMAEISFGISMTEKQTPALKRGGMVRAEKPSTYLATAAPAVEALAELE